MPRLLANLAAALGLRSATGKTGLAEPGRPQKPLKGLVTDEMILRHQLRKNPPSVDRFNTLQL